MKAATGELNLTIIVIIAIGLIAAFLYPFIKNTIFPSIENGWNNSQKTGYIEFVETNLI